MENIYKIMNEIDDDASLGKTHRFVECLNMHSLNESVETSNTLTEEFIVSYGRGQKTVKFNTVDDAIKHINDGMKNRTSETFVLLNDSKEMIWLDRYRDENNEDLGYTVSRQEDKSVTFDSKTGLSTSTKVEYDDSIRRMVVSQCSQTKKLRAGQMFAKMNFVKDNSKPSHIDDNKVVHLNTDMQLDDSIDILIKQLNDMKESLNELFGLGKKQDRYLVVLPKNTLTNKVFTYDIKRDISQELKRSARNLTLAKHNTISDDAHFAFEFTASPDELQSIKNSIMKILRKNNTDSAYAKEIKFKVIDKDVKAK